MKKLLFLLLTMLATSPTVVGATRQTPEPVIEIVESQDYYTIHVTGLGQLTVRVTGVWEGESGEYHEDLIDEDVVDGEYSFVVNRMYDSDLHLIVRAIAQVDGEQPSETAEHEFWVVKYFRLPDPEITFEENYDGVLVDVTVDGYGDLNCEIYVDGRSIDCSHLPVFIDRSDELQQVDVSATTTVSGGYGWIPGSSNATFELEPYIPSPDPIIMVEELDDCVRIDAIGDGEIYLFVNGNPVENPCYVERTEQEQNLEITAYAILGDYVPSTTVYMEYVVAPLIVPEPIDQTIAPTMSFECGEQSCIVCINESEPSDIYYRIGTYDESTGTFVFDDWMTYQFALEITIQGKYRVEAYAVAPGKESSLTCAIEFVFNPVIAPLYDFEKDGIYYIVTGSDKVEVCRGSNLYNSYSGQVNIPATVTYGGVTYMVTGIASDAFHDCPNLTGVSIGAYVTSIGNCAFFNCSSLTSVTLGDYVIDVDAYAFAGCTSLVSVTLGSGVARIGEMAFSGCTSLNSVTCKAATPPVVSDRNAFDCYESATLYVYPAVKERYRNGSIWSLFQIIEAQDKVAPSIGDVNGDGVTTVSDVTRLINMLLTGAN